MTSCRLCSDLLFQDVVAAWNEPLYESPNFVVLPSLGALVEGWLLLVPKNHFICMGAVPDSLTAEMQQMKHILCSVLRESYGQVCVFEHGPSRANLNIGCSVDHAHLHFVPLGFDLAFEVTSLLPEDACWSKAGLDECRAAFSRGDDYLYLEQPIGVGRIVTHREFGSQLFRRAIAMRIGASHEFNWREYPHFPNVFATIARVQTGEGSMFPAASRRTVA